MTEFTIHLANRPGQLAGLAKMMAEAEVNIEALAAFGLHETGVVRLLVSDPDRARSVISDGGLDADERRVVTTVLPHEPGALAQLTQALADAEINIDGMYVLKSHNDHLELALAVGDPEHAESLLS